MLSTQKTKLHSKNDYITTNSNCGDFRISFYTKLGRKYKYLSYLWAKKSRKPTKKLFMQFLPLTILFCVIILPWALRQALRRVFPGFLNGIPEEFEAFIENLAVLYQLLIVFLMNQIVPLIVELRHKFNSMKTISNF